MDVVGKIKLKTKTKTKNKNPKNKASSSETEFRSKKNKCTYRITFGIINPSRCSIKPNRTNANDRTGTAVVIPARRHLPFVLGWIGISKFPNSFLLYQKVRKQTERSREREREQKVNQNRNIITSIISFKKKRKDPQSIRTNHIPVVWL